MRAWMIEDGHDRCLGVIPSGKLDKPQLQWTTPLLALRFCRYEDAENMAAILAPCPKPKIFEHICS